MTLRRQWIAWSVAAIAAAGLGAWLARQHDSTPARLASGTWLTAARPVPQFTLQDHNGRPFTQANFKGHPTLVFFGFTNCPDVCPTTLAQLAKAKGEAGIEDLRVVMVSVDPERDTPSTLGAYLEAFDPEFIGLTGEKRTIDALAKGLGVAAARTELPGGTYTVDHTAAVFLLDGRGTLVGIFTTPIESPKLAADLRHIADRLAG
jgi:protein SCO1